MTPWIAAGRHTRSIIYHTEEDCPYLQRVQNPREVSEEKIEAQDRRECKYCSETEKRGFGGATKWHKINDKLKDPETTL